MYVMFLFWGLWLGTKRIYQVTAHLGSVVRFLLCNEKEIISTHVLTPGESKLPKQCVLLGWFFGWAYQHKEGGIGILYIFPSVVLQRVELGSITQELVTILHSSNQLVLINFKIIGFPTNLKITSD